MAKYIKTRVLVISDTHGLQIASTRTLQTNDIDMVIHCGDLTEHSRLAEFQETIRLLEMIKAPLKIVIPGNHDFSLDKPAFQRKIAEFQRLSTDLDGTNDVLLKEYGSDGDAKRLWDEAKENINGRIMLLDEGEHHLVLENGAQLKVYASPYTPSTNEWGFQYNSTHDFEIGDRVDIAITHGPPKGIMDRTVENERIGCPMLFRAIAKSQPRIHCFGHVHNGWGAKLATWRSHVPDDASHFNSIDNDKSIVVENLSRLKGSRFETTEEAEIRKKRIDRYEWQGYCDLRHCEPVTLGLQRTLFINAALKGDGGLDQLPWLVEIDLPFQEG